MLCMAVVVAPGLLQAMQQAGQAYEEEAPSICVHGMLRLRFNFRSYVQVLFWDAVSVPQLSGRNAVIIERRCCESVGSRLLSGCSKAIK